MVVECLSILPVLALELTSPISAFQSPWGSRSKRHDVGVTP